MWGGQEGRKELSPVEQQQVTVGAQERLAEGLSHLCPIADGTGGRRKRNRGGLLGTALPECPRRAPEFTRPRAGGPPSPPLGTMPSGGSILSCPGVK